MELTCYDKILIDVAEGCQAFEHIITAMGYGYSLLNVSSEDFVRRCNDCVNWQEGDCEIFQSEIHS